MTRREEAIDELNAALDDLCTAWNHLDSEVIGSYSDRKHLQLELSEIIKRTDALLTEMKKPRRVA